MKRAVAQWCIFALALCPGPNHFGGPESAARAKFKVLALTEAGGHHIEFTKAARPWLAKCGKQNGFEIDYITNTAPITEKFPASFFVFDEIYQIKIFHGRTCTWCLASTRTRLIFREKG